MTENLPTTDAGSNAVASPAPTATAAPEQAAAKGSGYFAHTNIIHEGQVIRVGAELPRNFPLDALKNLVKAKHISKIKPEVKTER